MAASFSATVTVVGDPASLQGYRLRVRELLDAEKIGDYRELHTIDALDWRFKLKGGIPFPSFVEASVAFPDLEVRVEWSRPGEGRNALAIIKGGNVSQQTADVGDTADAGDAEEVALDLEVAPDGELKLALIARRWRDEALVGYALSAEQHAWFHVRRDGTALVLTASDGMEAEWAERWVVTGEHAQYAELGERAPIEGDLVQELERLSSVLCSDWIWFAASAPEETVVERQRYEQYGLQMREANVRSVKLRTVMQAKDGGGFVFMSQRADVSEARRLLLRCWVQGH